MEKADIKRQEAIFELIYSEKAYLTDVDALIKVYGIPVELYNVDSVQVFLKPLCAHKAATNVSMMDEDLLEVSQSMTLPTLTTACRL